MKKIIVLGTGCTKCVKTAEIIEIVAKELGKEVLVRTETNPEVIMSYGVMSTPAVVVDDHLIHSGSVPKVEQVKEWLA